MTTRRARDLGIPFDGEPGAWNAVTDVPGVTVGYQTLVAGSGPLVPGDGPVRTGVTAILPRSRANIAVPCAAGWYSLNGNGEMTGTTWLEESGSLSLPVMLTNTHAVGAVHGGVGQWVAREHPRVAAEWLLPVVAETWDGYLNDINGGHVRPEHAGTAIEAAATGQVAEGSVGGGTGMNCYGFKGGSGTASRVVSYGADRYAVGAFVQANFGARAELTIAGVPVGRELRDDDPLGSGDWRGVAGAGSVIAVVATDAPLLPNQCKALARRVPMGLARTGTTGSHFSGDVFLAFSTANAGALTSSMHDPAHGYQQLSFIPWSNVGALYAATVQAVEEAVVNALVAATEMVGRDGHRSPALPPDRVVALLRHHDRLA